MKTLLAVLFLLVFLTGCVAVPVGYPTGRVVCPPIPCGGIPNTPPAYPQVPGGPQLEQAPAPTQQCVVFNGRRLCEDRAAYVPVYVYPTPVYYPPSFYMQWGSHGRRFIYRSW
jgi:hypothetical protein